jgi:hypothetical protein
MRVLVALKSDQRDGPSGLDPRFTGCPVLLLLDDLAFPIAAIVRASV